MYNHQLRVYGEYLAQQQIVPKNTVAQGNGGWQRAGTLMGAAEIVIKAATNVTLAAGRSLILRLEESADTASTSFLPLSVKITAGTTRTWQAGEAIGRLPVPSDSKTYLRVEIGTDDIAATGTVDVFFDYLPR